MALTVDAVRKLIFRQMGPTIRRVNLMVTRGVIRRVTDTAMQQLVQLSLLGDRETGDEEVADEVEHLQPFGLSFVPPADSEVVALGVGGNRDHLVAIGASSRAHRPTGAAEGEGGLYTLTGWKLFCDDEGNVYIGADAAGATHKIARDDLVKSEVEALWSALHSHTHSGVEPGAGNTAVPIGVPLGVAGDVGSSKAWVVE